MNWWRRLSIAAKLPLGMGTLLLLVLGGMTAIVYVDLRQAAMQVASERLDGVTSQLAGGLGGQTRDRVASLGALAARPAVAGYLSAGDDALRQAALERMESFADDDEAVVELWDAAGGRVLATASDTFPLDPAQMAGSVADPGPGTSAAAGPILREGNRTLLTTIASLREAETLLGYITERRPITASPEAVAAMTELVGERSRLLVGNATGTVWADMQGTPVSPPPVSATSAAAAVTYTRGDGTAVIGRAMGIPGTPWLLLIELPRAPVLAGATRFLARGILLSVVLATAGAMVGLLMSRRMSLPLRRVTDAAEALASGRAVEPVPVTRADEIGRLSASFNTMADQVLRSHGALERRVAARTAALEAANSELEAFSYSVSHDLRAPLRAVDGFAAILAEDHGAELSPEAGRYLDRIRGSAQQMGQLIDDLLAFSRLGRQPVGRAPVDMEELARGVIEDACRQEGRDPAEVEVQRLPPAHGEPSMLKQVFANLVQNALKFTRGRTPARITIGVHVGDDETVYFVRDNGVGFDMAYADKLFGVFQRLHAADEFEGTGVGLAVVKRIVQRHGGRVWAEAAPDAGATFRFTVPAVAPPTQARADHVEGAPWM